MKQLLRFASCLFLLFAFVFVYAQPEMQRPPMPGQSSTSGTVVGMIVDENSKPIEYASIYVKRTTDSTIAQTSITNETGRFMIQEIPFGEYFIEIQYIGYRKHYSKPFTSTVCRDVLLFDKVNLGILKKDCSLLMVKGLE